jgi:predicted MFS family arabinose efflux permease
VISRQFRLLFAGQAVSVVGDALFPVALAFAVLDELDGTPAQLGLVLAAQTLPLAVLILAAGVWADRVNRRNVMIVSDAGRAMVQATLAALLITDTAEVWHVVALGALYGVFDAGFQPAAGGLVPQVAGSEHLQRANALLGLARHVGMVIGPTLAGILIAISSPGTAIAVDAGTFVVSAAFLARLHVRSERHETEHHFWRDLEGGIREVAQRRWMWTFMPGFSAYHLLALPCVLALGPVIADRELSGASSWAAITTCFGIGTIAGSVVALRIAPRHPMYGATLAFLVAACQALIIAYGGSTLVIAALLLVAGVAVSYGFTMWDTSLGREIPADALSRVTSLDWFTTTGLMPIGFALVAPAAELFGTRTTMLASALIVLVLFLAALAVGDVRRLTAP